MIYRAYDIAQNETQMCDLRAVVSASLQRLQLFISDFDEI